MSVKYSVLKFVISGKGGISERKLGIFKNAKSDELYLNPEGIEFITLIIKLSKHSNFSVTAQGEL